MTVDFHAHVFPDRIAAETVRRLGAAAQIPYFTDGTRAGLAASMKRAGIDLTVLLPVATNPLKVDRLNDFAGETNERDGLCSLGAMHPGCPCLKEELRRVKALGLRGVKIHPVYQGAAIDSPPFLELLTAAAENGLFVVTHAGYDIGFPGVDHAAPARIANALRQTGPVRLVLAHMGGWKDWEAAVALADFPTVMIDTSFSLGTLADDNGYYTPEERHLLAPDAFVRLVRTFGAARVLFGTDSPWTDQAASLAAIRALPLTDAEKAAILGGNATRLLV